jgi:hypothetical protein
VYTILASYSPSYILSPHLPPLPLIPIPPGNVLDLFCTPVSVFVKKRKKVLLFCC